MPDMTPSERLTSMIGGATAEPVLSPEELADCLLRAAVPDSAGNFTASTDWVPSYDYARAAANGWRLKAAKVAADYSITIEGRELNRGQMVDNFLKMAADMDAASSPRYFGLAEDAESWRV